MSIDAVRLITSRDASKLLYLYLAFNSPHTPYQAPQGYLDTYKDFSDPARCAYAASITAWMTSPNSETIWPNELNGSLVQQSLSMVYGHERSFPARASSQSRADHEPT